MSVSSGLETFGRVSVFNKIHVFFSDFQFFFLQTSLLNAVYAKRTEFASTGRQLFDFRVDFSEVRQNTLKTKTNLFSV